MSDPLDALLAEVAAGRPAAGRPFVTLSYAQSLDGSIALREAESLALSGPASLAMTHRLRAAHDAILVGIGTVLADDPRLSVRHATGPNPRPVVLDSQLRLPLESRLLQGSPPPWIAAGLRAGADRQARLEDAGASILRVELARQGGLNLLHLLECLRQRGIERVMVEGGARVITSFLSEKLVDLFVLTVAPVIVGGVPGVHDLGIASPEQIPRLEQPQWVAAGSDLVVWGRLGWGTS